MDIINELKKIVIDNDLETKENILIQLELLRDYQDGELGEILTGILQKAQEDPEVIKGFVDEYQQNIVEFLQTGAFKTPEALDKYISNISDKVDQAEAKAKIDEL